MKEAFFGTGGSYVLDSETGRITLIERTADAATVPSAPAVDQRSEDSNPSNQED